MSAGTTVLQPTFTGWVATTRDALVLFEACLSGQLSHVPRRPHDRERNSLIRHGSVFIYEENSSGIKRWTDGVIWSPSRILGNFLVYRELDRPFPPGEKKKANKNKRRPTRPGEPYSRPDPSSRSYSPTNPHSAGFVADRNPTESDRQLIGSLWDSYEFKEGGLVKKTMSVTVQGVTHHLVSYYNKEEAKQLPIPSHTLAHVIPRPELLHKQSFRAGLDDLDDNMDASREGQPGPFNYRPMGPQSYLPGSGPYYPHGSYPQPLPHHGPPSGYHVTSPTIGGNYPPTQLGSGQVTQREGEYASFGHSSYGRSYDPLSNSLPPGSHSNSMPPTPTSVLPPNLSDRPPPHHPTIYPPTNLPQRPISTQSPVSLDPRSPTSYNGRSAYSIPVTTASPSDQSRVQMQSAPIFPSEDRRGSQHHTPGQIYSNDRPPFYATDGRSMSHGQYHPGPPTSPWQSSAPGQPAI